jgi:hypothetical protein
MTPSSKSYFTDLGINVEFNTLGASPQLVSAYIANTQDITNMDSEFASEHKKLESYSQFYTFSPRAKLTGFENFRKLDTQFRISQAPNITEAQIKPCDIEAKAPSSNNYKQELLAHLAAYTKPIVLYLSGGLDSELVANALLEANIPFTPVIFRWTDGVTTQNNEEFQHAFDFCSSHGLTPNVQTFNVIELWASESFKKLSVDTQIVSPQLVTHAFMVTVMNTALPNSQHLFGGEVRYRTNYLNDNGTLSNIVLLIKVSPGYNGGYYQMTTSTGAATSCVLQYRNDGVWTTSLGSGNPTSGTWTTTPGVAYEYRITAISAATSGNLSPTAASAPTAWAALSASITTIARAYTNAGAPNPADATFYIEVRKVGTTSPVMSSSISLVADNS